MLRNTCWLTNICILLWRTGSLWMVKYVGDNTVINALNLISFISTVNTNVYHVTKIRTPKTFFIRG